MGIIKRWYCRNEAKYKKWHLGSRGQRTGIYYTGIDDFDLIIPDFKTSLMNDKGKVGTMQDLMINTKPLSNKNYQSRYTYDNVLDQCCDANKVCSPTNR